jgi:cyclic dehypoxanthinyl futalosine synthase
MRFKEVMAKALDGDRLNPEEAWELYQHTDFHMLGYLAHQVRLRKHPEPQVTYVVDRNINYTNICVCGCRFCAFFRAPGQPGGTLLTRDELAKKIEETLALGGTQILLQGGHHPDLPLSYYEDMLRFIKAPSQSSPCFSPPEIIHFRIANKPIRLDLAVTGCRPIRRWGGNPWTRCAAFPNRCSAGLVR